MSSPEAPAATARPGHAAPHWYRSFSHPARRETRDSVDRRLRDAGYKVHDATTYYKEEFYNPSRYLFDTLACEVLYVVDVQFDEAAHLVGATGDADSGCY